MNKTVIVLSVFFIVALASLVIYFSALLVGRDNTEENKKNER